MLDELLERLAADEEQLLNCVDLATRWAWPDTTMNPPQKIVALYGALSEAGSPGRSRSILTSDRALSGRWTRRSPRLRMN
jgi:hypothetical protein